MSEPNPNGRWEFDEKGNVRYVAPDNPYGQRSGPSSGSGQTRSGGSSSGGKQDDGWHWILIVLGFIFFWPIGLVLLLLELTGYWNNPTARQKVRQAGKKAANAAKNAVNPSKATGYASPPPFQSAQQARGYSEQDKARASDPRQQKKAAEKAAENHGLGHIKGFRIAGGILAGVFGFAFVAELLDELRYFYSLYDLLGEVLPLLALCLAGVTLLGVAGIRSRKLKRFRKYLAMIGDQQEVFIPTLASTLGRPEKKVTQDLQEMLDRGFFACGYVDLPRRTLVLREWVSAPAEGDIQPEPAPEADMEDENSCAASLRRIREVNDAIANPELSAKIDRIEELTAKIFRLLDERPEKAGELRSFMSYYLPQTLKILDNYARLEAQGIEGDNIAGAKVKIENMMDKLVDGYETQLDKLFEGDVMDISADLKVMESMLEKDGLTAEHELRF